MAGYVFTVSKNGWADFCEKDLKHGYFTPLVPESDQESTERKIRSWTKTVSAIFGDMITMSPGDNVYFLSDRKIYGVGKLVRIGEDCKYDNYPGASRLLPDPEIDEDTVLTTRSLRARWVLLFEHDPYFFKKGADMDDILRYRPSAFKMLRAFQGVTFIKIDDEENRALKEYIALINEESYNDIETNTFAFSAAVHDRLDQEDLSGYVMDINSALQDEEHRDRVMSEMFIEASLLQTLSRNKKSVIGHWDHLTQQLIASPFKPLDYVDKIDIYGYRYSVNYPGEPKLITKYLVIEIKKDKINKAAVEQAMQYVDWVCSEYAAGDYSKISAFVVGAGAVRNIDAVIKESCQRRFIASSHPAVSEQWNDFKLIKYTITDDKVFFGPG